MPASYRRTLVKSTKQNLSFLFLIQTYVVGTQKLSQ